MEKIKDIVRCVFQAEHDINEGVIEEGEHKGMSWSQVLRSTSGESQEVRDGVADEYVTAIAERIVEKGWISVNK